MTKIVKRPIRTGSALVVSSNPETLDGLTQYLSQAGVPSESRRRANPLADLPENIRTLIVFPDDFPEHEVASYLFVARTRRPDMTLVLVTRDPQTYTALTTTGGHQLKAVVLARPAFGWAILDVIRSALETTSAL